MGLLAQKRSGADVFSEFRRLGDEERLLNGKIERELLVTGLESLDRLVSGFPRGAISEIIGPESSGRTTLLYRLLAVATSNQEICACVDVGDSFDPRTASLAGVTLTQLLWIRCRNNLDHALKALDYLLHGGGFGIVVLDMGPTLLPSQKKMRLLPSSYWYRFRQPLEHTRTTVVVVARESLARQCASLRLEMKPMIPNWVGAAPSVLLRGARIEAVSQRPFRNGRAQFGAEALQASRAGE